jgi:predicted small secreted protein
MKLALGLIVFLLLFTQTACDTVQGPGSDIEATGDAVGDLARDVEDELED